MLLHYVQRHWVLHISDYFSVSFESCVYRLAYKLNLIEGDINSKILKKRIREFKPDSKRIQLGIRTQNLENLRNIINCSEFSFQNESRIIWEKFKINFIFNENRLEGVKIGYDEISEIITDLRLKKQNSEYCRSNFQNIIDVVGHSTVIDFINTTNDKISIFLILKLHQLMGQYHPYPEAFGQFRNSNNLVIESKFETTDYHDISTEISNLGKMVDHLHNNMDSIPLSEYIEACIRIHHKITVIHPFADGNGRISRAFLNWQLRVRGIPPIYIKHENKSTYFDSLSKADLTSDYNDLFEVFYFEILRSMIELNSKYHFE
ncbi:MAG: Fic family protein [Anaerolineaceae bacterium]|nr:Fic family protein [Anaerolineaceae bacterium]